ncbi:glutathione S-transferase family protein [Rhodospirillum centenum]|uniref:Glutathione S-transferase, putative n=1 Tax=Rhodospirillum centenum (strain ATCC 51521 / SW) TaxID=414684 RepID=B6IU36_RHOCS|nr:glutathione S-transferase family protein [Rhodospirillum centenum]ACI99913.1 glutathione S-transferase, putative [Rhodospirillum centenum SW]
MPTLYGCPGCGSAAVEAAFTLAGEPYEYILTDPGGDPATVARLHAVNPMGQVPALLLEDGTVLTESAAILLWLADRHPRLAPAPGDPARAPFLRWLLFLAGAVYPMYTVGDFPERWVGGEAAQRELRTATVARILSCWRTLEQALDPAPLLPGPRLSGPWLLGAEPTLLDIYAATLSRWRPGRDRIRVVAPRVIAACERAEALPALAPVWARNFPEG